MEIIFYIILTSFVLLTFLTLKTLYKKKLFLLFKHNKVIYRSNQYLIIFFGSLLISLLDFLYSRPYRNVLGLILLVV